MIFFLKSKINQFKYRLHTRSDTSHLLAFTHRQALILGIIDEVGESLSGFSYRVQHASNNSQLDLVQADIYTLLALDRGESYAQGVLFALDSSKTMQPDSGQAHLTSDYLLTSARQAGRSKGFSLIELMVVVAIAAILASIALPGFASSIKKQKIRAAQSDLAVLVLMMENRFQQQLAYPAATTTTAATQSTFTGWSPAGSYFVYTIASVSNTAPATYTLTAAGIGDLSACTISIDQSNTRTTSGCITGSTSWQ